MAYSELIKNFNKIRDYMRDFYVYGFKSRDDYTKKSARSYDDEKRRIESWLGNYMKFHRTADGKNVFLSIDSRATKHNPLYKAWKTKSFTDGDITLHFIVMDMLSNGQELSLGDVAYQVDEYLAGFEHARVFDISTIRKKLNEYWQLLKEDGTTTLRKKPTMPLTILQKRWINAIALDPRIRLFTDRPVVFSDVEPLFLPEDIYVFDKYSDGDPYENPKYIRNFRLILDAIKHRYQIQISIINRHGKQITTRTIPEYLEYSEKDDKFRLIGTGSKLRNTINLGRIISCEKYENQQGGKVGKRNQPRQRKVIFELIDERNALERVLMHFAHLEKQVEKIDERKYQVTLYYDKEDETEILIRVLSFGPMLHVVKPVAFINLIKDRLSDQKSCGL